MALPSSLDFAGISAPVIEVVDVHRHAAEKFHAMLRSFGDRENSRVRDLVDIVILREHDLIDAGAAAVATRQVWGEREGGEPPGTVGHLPPSWPSRYEHLAAEHGLAAKSFPAAVDLVDQLWTEMFPTEEA